MIDWLTMNCLYESILDQETLRAFVMSRPQIMKWNPVTGEVEWANPCHEVVRSDSHQVQVRFRSDRITVFGSPARSMGLSHNVFGISDIVECARAHVRVVREHVPFDLPGAEEWFPSCIDVTHNYDLGGVAEVRQALNWLRQTNGGRYRVDNKHPETVYWNKSSVLNANKAYHKGSHLRYQQQKGVIEVTEEELELADRLLRLENRRANEWWRRFREAGKDWKKLTESDLDEIHNEAFNRIIGENRLEVTMMDTILENLKKVVDDKTGKAISDNQALAAYRTWSMIKMVGVEEAKAGMSRRSWYVHQKLLFSAGLSWADFSSGNIVPFRRKVLVLGEPVKSFDEMRRAA